MKKCTNCWELKESSCFYKHKKGKDGLRSQCIQCIKNDYLENKVSISARLRTKDGVVYTMYHSQKSSSKRRGHEPPKYSIDEFKSWVFSQNKFDKLYDNWVASGYKKDIKPSCDRGNNYLPYSFSNITLMTWLENRKNRELQVVSGAFRVNQRPVVKLSVNMKFIKTYHSIMQADRDNSCDFRNIHKVCNGRDNSSGGFKWIYAEDYYKQFKINKNVNKVSK